MRAEGKGVPGNLISSILAGGVEDRLTSGNLMTRSMQESTDMYEGVSHAVLKWLPGSV